MIQHIIRGDQRHVLRASESPQFTQSASIAFAVQHGGGKPHAARCMVRQLPQQSGAFFHIAPAETLRRHDDQQQTVLPRDKIGKRQNAFAFFGAQFAGAEQAAEIAIGYAILRVSEDVGCVIRKRQPRTNQQSRQRCFTLALHLFQRVIGTHDAGDRITIGNADGGIAIIHRGFDQLMRMRRTTQERKIRGDGKLGVIHAKLPCMYQRATPFSRP